MNLLISEYIRTLTYYWSGYLYSNIRYSAKNIQLFEYIWIFNKLWYIFMNEYYSVFHIRKISWPNTIWYSVFEIFFMNKYYSVLGIRKFFHERIYIQYSNNFHERILFGIQKFFMNKYIRYSVFGQIHYSVQLCWGEVSERQRFDCL